MFTVILWSYVMAGSETVIVNLDDDSWDDVSQQMFP
jgi:hypothetical protein